MAEPPAPEKRKRQVHRKTRTGCKTCKIRKVKCDEERPACKRCTSTGRKCDGYLSPRTSQISPLAPASRTGASILVPGSPFSLALTKQIEASIPGTPAEKRGFQYFVANTAGELSGYFNEEFWKGVVLRGCWQEGALRHAVLSLSALHESFEREGEVEKVNGAIALHQYSKAISQLRKTINPTNPNQSPLIALISCILLISFDSLRGSFDSAMLHLQSGLSILREVRNQIKTKSKRNGKLISEDEKFIVQRYLTPLFVRSSLQVILYVDTRTVEEKLMLASSLSLEDSDQALSDQTDEEEDWVFKDLDEARDKLNAAAAGLFRMQYMLDATLPFSQQTAVAHSLYATHSRAEKCWDKAFAAYISQHSASMTSKQIRAAALLKIHHTTLVILSIKRMSVTDPRPIAEVANSPVTFISEAKSFATIVALSKSLILAIEQDAQKEKANGKGKTFSPDLGIVGPLYYVGMKCTVKTIRDEAQSLLDRWKGREGMWDSSMGGKLLRDFWGMVSKFDNQSDHNDQSDQYTSVSGFESALTSDRVKLVLTKGNRWVWKYRTSANEDDGVFETMGDDDDDGDVEAQDEAFNTDSFEWDWDTAFQDGMDFSTGATQPQVGDDAAGFAPVLHDPDWIETLLSHQQQPSNLSPDPGISMVPFESALQGMDSPAFPGWDDNLL